MPDPGGSILWFRQDLRLADNPALLAAVARGGPIFPVYIWAPEEEGDWPPGEASRWWLHQSLHHLEGALRQRHSRLLLRRGPTLMTLRELLKETGATAVFWNRRYEPAAIARDTSVKSALRDEGIHVETFNGSLLYEPWAVQTREGRPYQVFTPFWKACLAGAVPAPPAGEPPAWEVVKRWPMSLPLAALELEPTIDWTGGLHESWRPGEQEASTLLEWFRDEALSDYAEARNRPDLPGTSRLSPHLHFGEISVRQVWSTLQAALRGSVAAKPEAARVFAAELGWREFAYHLLFHFPQTPRTPLREQYARFPWETNRANLRKWQRGRTGFPLVDAGMRQLWHTGWMHNRARMVVASFLVKDLLIPWQKGAAWFWDTLVDADLANNTLGWQWTAGCGADAAPYFRIFNPTGQAEKYDPDGAYLRTWLPELRQLPTPWIHKPWEAPDQVLADAGVVLGQTYPRPILDHHEARLRALERLKQIQD